MFKVNNRNDETRNIFKVNNKHTRTTPFGSFWFLYCQLKTYFTPCSSVSIVNFDQVNAGWGTSETSAGCAKLLKVFKTQSVI